MLETRQWQVVEAEAVIAGLPLDAEVISKGKSRFFIRAS